MAMGIEQKYSVSFALWETFGYAWRHFWFEGKGYYVTSGERPGVLLNLI